MYAFISSIFGLRQTNMFILKVASLYLLPCPDDRASFPNRVAILAVCWQTCSKNQLNHDYAGSAQNDGYLVELW